MKEPRRKKGWVAVVGDGSISRVHPALARIRRRKRQWVRRRGASFRLFAEARGCGHSSNSNEGVCPDGFGCATAGQPASGCQLPGHLSVLKLILYASGPLRALKGKRHQDGRTLRGALLKLLSEQFGEAISFGLANHGSHRKSALAVSLSRANNRRAFVTLLSQQDAGARQILRELETLLCGHPLTLGVGEDARTVTVKAKLVEWQPRGVYLNVMAPGPSEAQALVPSAGAVQLLPGSAGRQGESLSWRVQTRRTGRFPVQVGGLAAYGYGVVV